MAGPRFEAVDYDPFKAPPVKASTPAFEAVDYDPFKPQSSTPPSTPALSGVSPEPVNQPRYNPAQSAVPENPQQRTMVPSPTPQTPVEVGPDTSPIGDTEPPGANPSQPWAFTKGLWTTTLEQNPRLFAEALEGASLLSGVDGQDPLASTLMAVSKEIRGLVTDPGAYKMKGTQFTDIRSLDDALTFLGESSGQALGSTLPTVLPSMFGAGIGARMGGRTGALVGAAGGAALGGLPQAYGEVFAALKEAGVDPQRSAAAARIPAAIITGLDSVVPAGMISKLGGMTEVKREVARGIARRMAAAMAANAGKEGLTETLQEIVKDAQVSMESGKDFWTPENLKNWVNSGAAGAVGGATFGTAEGVQRDKVTTPIQPGSTTDAGTAMGIPQSTTPAAPAIAPGGEVSGVRYLPGQEPAQEPVDVQANVQVFQPSPEDISGAIEIPKTPTFFSPAKRFVEEKGQNVATAEQWLNTIRNAPGVKQEELTDTGILDFLNDAKERGEKVTKSDLLREMEERSITVEERELEGNQQQYGLYTIPGDVQGYTELLLKIPEQRGQDVPFVAPHFDGVDAAGAQNKANKNLLAHARVSERLDIDDVPVMVIEEIQSDWHQRGRKEGYATPEANAARGADIQFLEDTDKKMVKAVDANPNSPLGRAFQSGTERQVLMAAANEGVITFEEATRYEEANKSAQRELTPDAPFKSSWDELAFKRVLRWAADKGYRRIAIANSKEQGRRYGQLNPDQPAGWQFAGGMGLNASQMRGMQEFYDKKMPSMMKKWAKRLGGRIVETSFYDTARGDGYVTIELPQHGLDTIRQGLPQYNLAPETNAEVTVGETTPDMMAVADALKPALEKLIQGFKFGKPVSIHLHKKAIKYGPNKSQRYPGAAGLMVTYPDRFEIHVGVGYHPDAANIWATMTHELGHVVDRVHLAQAPAEVKTSLRAAYDAWRAKVKPDTTMRQIIATRDNFVAHWWRHNAPGNSFDAKFQDLSKRNYWVSFEEWFAEETARWATTNQIPLTTVEQFFSGLAKTLLRLWAKAADIFNLPYQPSKAVADYLNSFHTTTPFAEDIYKAHEFMTQQDNQRQMGMEEAGVPMQPETAAVRERLEKLFEGKKGLFGWRSVKRNIAYADKFSWLYKVFFGIHQIAQRNPHIASLQQYVETISVAQLTKQQIMSSAHDVIKQWNQLGRKRSDNLGAFIDDINNMVYRTPDEVKKRVSRMPTQVEFNDLVTKHGLDAETLGVFRAISASFRDHLTRYQAVLMKEASKITDPKARNQREQEIVLMIAALRNKPYFPAMRFGNYTLTIRDAADNVIHFETFETKRQRKYAAEDIIRGYNVPQDKVQLGFLHDQAQPLLGVPTQLLDLMGEKLKLSQAQKDALQQLKFELSPAQSFKHRFQHKRRIAGYSMDFRRAYANYFFHGANHMMRVMYADDLRLLAKATRTETKQFDATKRHQIANAMSQHLENWLDPKSDWMAIRSIAFLWSLAFSPAAATQNLMQTVMTSYPFLASKFGDHKAIPMLMRVMGDWTTFYKRGTYENMSGFEYQAISKGIQEGVITEAMAPELAGIAEGGNFSGAAGETVERAFTALNEMGSKMFEYAEQTNRRIVFRAALKLAQANINSKYVKEMVQKHSLKYKQLRGENWTEAQAAAYVTALDATHETQFRYGREFAPRFMQGGLLRTVFVFKTFITSYMIFLGHYPTAMVRSLLMLGFLGGLMAQPGAEDIEGIVKMVGWRLFGKDWDVEKEVRKLVIQLAGEDERGRQMADFVLHGAARRGFGWPQFFDMLGGTVGVDVPMPTLDRSRAVSGGTLLPVDFGVLFGPPTQSTEQKIADQTQKASGALFGAGFNIYKAIVNERLDVDDAKRYERAVPRFMGSVTRSWRYWNEGMERSQTGAPVVKFDTRDWEQLMEIAAVAAGYMPLRVSGYWDKTIAKRDEDKLWDIRRQMLMKQAANALRGGDEKEIEGIRTAITTFNETLPEDARGKAITKKSLDASIKMRERQRQATETGVPMKKSSVPIYQAIDRLYPDYESIVKKVR